LSKRTIGILVLLAVVGFYALGTGFDFFYRLLYVILALLVIGLAWAWLNLRGLEVQLNRNANRGQVGEYLEGRIRLLNRFRFPKSWLEVVEVSDLPGHASGRGVALIRDQSRTWKIETYLGRRGIYHTGQIEVTSQDPFGLFRLRRRFLEPQTYIVFPATQPLPDLDPQFAGLPMGTRATRRSDHITPDIASVRQYIEGDSFRRIHWPYTARMNTLMVKEFDMGMSAEAWVLLDMQGSVHLGDDLDNTEELGVTIAASIISRLLELSIPVGLAADGDQTYILRPDSSAGQQPRLLEVLAAVRALGRTPLESFVYELQPYVSRFNTLTIITPSLNVEWLRAVNDLRRRGIRVGVVFIDPQSFGGTIDSEFSLNALFMSDIPTYQVKRGQLLNDALHLPLNQGKYISSIGATSPQARRGMDDP
jgi:uncharacterized protein (DUF58 family)